MNMNMFHNDEKRFKMKQKQRIHSHCHYVFTSLQVRHASLRHDGDPGRNISSFDFHTSFKQGLGETSANYWKSLNGNPVT